MILVMKAEYDDLKSILDLQYLAYQSEAALFETNDISPLKQTLEEVVRIRKRYIFKDGIWYRRYYRISPSQRERWNCIHRKTDGSSGLPVSRIWDEASG